MDVVVPHNSYGFVVPLQTFHLFLPSFLPSESDARTWPAAGQATAPQEYFLGKTTNEVPQMFMFWFGLPHQSNQARNTHPPPRAFGWPTLSPSGKKKGPKLVLRVWRLK